MRFGRCFAMVVVALVAPSCGGSSSPAGPGIPLDANSADRPADAGTDAVADVSAGGDASSPGDGTPAADASGGADVASDGADGGPTDAMACTPLGTCNPLSANACTGGQVCGPTGTAAGTACSNVTGAIRNEGDSCGGAMGTCAAGLFCINDGTAASCRRVCPKGSRGMCGPDKSCAGISSDPCLMLCFPREPACDIYAQNCASVTDSCGLVSDRETGQRYTGCVLAGAGAEGQPCQGQLNCGKGLICIRTAGAASSTCTRVCKPNGAPACAGGQTCTGLSQNWSVTYCEAAGDGGAAG